MVKRVGLAVVICIAAVACGTADAAIPELAATTTTTLATTSTTLRVEAPEPPRYRGFDQSRLPTDVSLAAIALGEVEVYDEPGEPEPSRVVPATTVLGTTTVFAVLGAPDGDWAHVMVPGRPNGADGWIALSDVHLYVVQGRIVIDLSDRELVLYRAGEEVLRTDVATGTSRNPTPTGRFFVTDSVTMANPNSPWGPHALGLSARSDTITEYNGGDGIIGIHGTNRPGSIGRAASLGCVRLPNEVITLIHELVAIGTPVEIRA